MSEWLRATRAERCPICDKDSWCTFTSDRAVVKCMRVQSGSAHPKGGWMHFNELLKCSVVSPPKKPAIHVDAESLARDCYLHPNAPRMRQRLSESLGVSIEALERMRVGWGDDFDGTEWASFPSRDSDGRIIGVTRRYTDGSKRTYAGTSNGIFYPLDWRSIPGVVLIVEGGSDVTAAISKGVCALGRPSNIGGADMILDLLSKNSIHRPIVVVGENDEDPSRRGRFASCPVSCTGCSLCFPGKFGAEYVASKLGCNYCMPPFPFKDLRDLLRDLVWVNALSAISVKNFSHEASPVHM